MPLSEKDLNHILTHGSKLWGEISGKRLFITGGTGFFGKWLLESFNWINKQLNLNSHMLVLTRNPDAFFKQYPHFTQMPDIGFYRGDIRNFDFPKGNFDFIIHAATDVSEKLNAKEPLLIIDTIVEGTRRVLDFSKYCHAKKILLTSSGAVYGRKNFDGLPLQEDYSGSPDITALDSVYGEAKRLAELLCVIYQAQYDVEISIARCFALVGPYLNLDIHFAIGNFIRDGLNSKTINVKGDGTPYRSYLYAADLAVWLWTILLTGKTGRAYNVGSDKEISIAELAERVSSHFKTKPKVKIAKTPDIRTKPVKYVPSTKRAENELGLKCWINLDEAIKRTIDFYSKNYE